jgi:hypothetical protein
MTMLVAGGAVGVTVGVVLSLTVAGVDIDVPTGNTVVRLFFLDCLELGMMVGPFWVDGWG